MTIKIIQIMASCMRERRREKLSSSLQNSFSKFAFDRLIFENKKEPVFYFLNTCTIYFSIRISIYANIVFLCWTTWLTNSPALHSLPPPFDLNIFAITELLVSLGAEKVVSTTGSSSPRRALTTAGSNIEKLPLKRMVININ